MRVRDCPAAVNGNENHHQHWSIQTGKRWSVDGTERSHARESEDLPAARVLCADLGIAVFAGRLHSDTYP